MTISAWGAAASEGDNGRMAELMGLERLGNRSLEVRRARPNAPSVTPAKFDILLKDGSPLTLEADKPQIISVFQGRDMYVDPSLGTLRPLAAASLSPSPEDPDGLQADLSKDADTASVIVELGGRAVLSASGSSGLINMQIPQSMASGLHMIRMKLRDGASVNRPLVVAK